MLSRTADHLFWMARYMERVESAATQRLDAVKTRPRAAARSGVFGQKGVSDAL